MLHLGFDLSSISASSEGLGFDLSSISAASGV